MDNIFKGVENFRVKKVYSNGKELYYPHVLKKEEFMKFFNIYQWWRIGIHGENKFGLYHENEDYYGYETLEEAQEVIENFKKAMEAELTKEVSYIE